MALKRFFAGLIFLMCSGLVGANTLPDSGWWWNASESGRGYSIEVQDDQLYFAAYTYDSNGAATWYYSSGKLTGDNYFAARVYKTSNGSCFGCSQKTPASADVGAMSISFSSNTTATLNILGFSTVIKRFDFTGGGNTTVPLPCYGEWTATIGSTTTGVYSGDRMRFTTANAFADGSPFLSGTRLGNASATAVCFLTEAATSTWGAGVTYNGYTELFVFKFIGFNLIEGNSWTYPSSSSPTGSGLPFVAFRTASKSYVQGHGGPTTSKSKSISGTAAAPVATNAAATRTAQDKLMASQNADRSPALPAVVDAANKVSNLINVLNK